MFSDSSWIWSFEALAARPQKKISKTIQGECKPVWSNSRKWLKWYLPSSVLSTTSPETGKTSEKSKLLSFLKPLIQKWLLVSAISWSFCHPSSQPSLATSAWTGKYLMHSFPFMLSSVQIWNWLGIQVDLSVLFFLSCTCPPFSLPSEMKKESYWSRFLTWAVITLSLFKGENWIKFGSGFICPKAN